MHPLYLIDSSIYIFRAYFSMPDSFFSEEGESVNAVYGYTHFLLDLLLKTRPVYVSAAFDESLTQCFRNKLYPLYKANRELPDENLAYQLNQCRRMTELLGIHSLSHSEYEADDIIGSLKKMLGRKRGVIVVTRDKDLGQILGKNDLIWDYAQDEYMAPRDIENKMGVPPGQIADFLALAGDSVDNIPGAPGIGAKTAVQLLRLAGSLKALLKKPEQVLSSDIRGGSRIYETLCDHREQLKIFREITQIACDMNIQVELKELKPQITSREHLEGFCDEMGFGTGVRNKINQIESR